MAKSLFITYDGLTDTLGQSQILPYLTGLANQGHEISILSCEKKEKYYKNKSIIEDICSTHHITWTPLFFHTWPPIISKYYDLFQLTAKAFSLYKKEQFDIIHCRSYLSADIGMKLKKRFGVKYLFDMRGFWVDERVDGGLWDMNSFLYRYAYKKWKRKEAEMIRQADHIISLTKAGKKEIQQWTSYTNTPITVIPCSADMDLFTLTSIKQKEDARKILQINDGTFVLSYLGSLGTWYLLDEMLLLYKELKRTFKQTKFLVLSPDNEQKVFSKAEEIGLKKDDFIFRFAQRKEVPQLMKASDVSVSFIKPAYSKIASSPTKLGELLAMGIPVICNDIGDVASIIEKSNGGIIIKDFSPVSIQGAAEYALTLIKGEPCISRETIEKYYSLSLAITQYNEVYKIILEKTN